MAGTTLGGVAGLKQALPALAESTHVTYILYTRYIYIESYRLYTYNAPITHRSVIFRKTMASHWIKTLAFKGFALHPMGLGRRGRWGSQSLFWRPLWEHPQKCAAQKKWI